MRRRAFLTLAGGAAAWPLAARAQQSERMRRVGILMPYPVDDIEAQARVAACRKELSRLGWTAEKARLDERWAGSDDANSIRAHARALVDSRPDVIVVNSPRALAPLQQATSTIPIVFVGISDPVGAGFVKPWHGPGATAPALP